MKVMRLLKKIKKIIEWLPILWRDEDWDFEFLLEIIKYKIQRMSNCIHRNDIISKHEQRQIFIGMNQAIHHIDNYLRDTEAYEDIHGKLPFDIAYEHKLLNNGNYSIVSINAETRKPLTPDENEKFSEWIMKANDFQQKEWEAIFDTIKKEGQSWWD